MQLVEVRKGQRWEVVREIRVHGLTHWRAPFTGGFDCTLDHGAVLIVNHDPLPKKIAVACTPENYKGLEIVIVPENDREKPKYDGYSLVVHLAEFGDSLKQL